MSNSGLSVDRLGRMREAMAGHVERGHVSGIVTLISRRDEVQVDTIGTKSVDGDPMQRDTIFRIASMTKPVAAVAAMILVEECKLRLDDPVDPLLPELANQVVLRSIESPLDDTVAANRPITLRDLLTLTFGTGAILEEPGKYPIQAALDEQELASGADMPPMTPDEYMRRLGELPLVYQPGERWLYDTGSDVLGILISRCTGQPLSSFFRERIFDPLGMNDTGFTVPEAKLDRLADCYLLTEAGDLEPSDTADDSLWSRPPIFESAAGGLVSTVDDYLAFCKMLLGNGKLGDARILSRPSVELMTMDHLTKQQRSDGELLLGVGTGWGFGVSVVTERAGLATPGTFGWDGGYTTSGHTDPEEELVGILMTQIMAGFEISGGIYSDFWTSVYQSIDD